MKETPGGEQGVNMVSMRTEKHNGQFPAMGGLALSMPSHLSADRGLFLMEEAREGSFIWSRVHAGKRSFTTLTVCKDFFWNAIPRMGRLPR